MLAKGAIWAATQGAQFIATAAQAVVSGAVQVASAVSVAAGWIAANAAMIIASGGIILAIGALIIAALWLHKHWREVWTKIKEIIAAGVNWIKQHMALVILVVTGPVGLLVFWIVKHWGAIWKFITDAVDAGRKFIGTAISGIVTFFTQLPGKVLGVLKGANSWLIDTGRNVIQGFLNGAGSLLSTIGHFFLDKLPGWIQGPFKKALGISSPSKVFHLLGLNITQGLINGLEAGKAGIISHVRSMGDAVLKHAESVLAGLQSKSAAMSKSVRDSLIQSVDITSAQGQNGKAVTTKDVLGNLYGKVNNLRKFSADLTRLKSAGIRGDLYQQIVNAGPDQGLPIAEALLAGGKAAVTTANRYEAATLGLSSKIGQQVANDNYGRDIAAAARTVRIDNHLVNELHVYLDGQEITPVLHKHATKHAQKKKKRNGQTGYW
jgi:hypothetical protein